MNDLKVELRKYPSEEDMKLVKEAIWVTMGKWQRAKNPPSDNLLYKILKARHSPIRLMTFVFAIENIPSNTSVHLCRHIHAVPFVESLRNDRQTKMDGDAARRDTPVNMLYMVNAEELMIIANKRLCGKASANTRKVVKAMCDEAVKVCPMLNDFLVPMCHYCHECKEVEPCGLWDRVQVMNQIIEKKVNDNEQCE